MESPHGDVFAAHGNLLSLLRRRPCPLVGTPAGHSALGDAVEALRASAWKQFEWPNVAADPSRHLQQFLLRVLNETEPEDFSAASVRKLGEIVAQFGGDCLPAHAELERSSLGSGSSSTDRAQVAAEVNTPTPTSNAARVASPLRPAHTVEATNRAGFALPPPRRGEAGWRGPTAIEAARSQCSIARALAGGPHGRGQPPPARKKRGDAARVTKTCASVVVPRAVLGAVGHSTSTHATSRFATTPSSSSSSSRCVSR